MLPVLSFPARNATRLYTPVWKKPSDFSDIVVSKRMFFDHIPTKSCPRFVETFDMLRKEARLARAAAADVTAATAATLGGGGGAGRHHNP